MAGRKKTVVESTEQSPNQNIQHEKVVNDWIKAERNMNNKQEVSTDIENIAVDEAITELKKINDLDKISSYITDASPIENVGVIFHTRYYEKDKFINGNTIFIPGVKLLVIENEDGTIEKRLVHINH